MNVIVICSDTFRYDHLGFLKLQPVQTPHLDRLAAQSSLFSDFRLCSFPSVINRIEMFTGRCSFPFFRWRPLPYEFPVLSEVLTRHGFTTAFFSDNRQLIYEKSGIERGFHVVRRIPGRAHGTFQPASAPMVELPCPAEKIGVRASNLNRYRRNACWYRQQGIAPAAVLFQSVMEWFDQPRDRFLVWVDTFDPHEPWDAPSEYLQPYPWNDQGDAVIWPKSGYADRYPEADLTNMRSLYKAAVTHFDHWIGTLLEHLRVKGVLENAAVIFCSDHGYYFGEHGLLGKPSLRQTKHPTPFYDEIAHIPLLMRFPDGLGAGQTFPGLCQPPDIYATALDLAGIESVPWAQGNSLLPRLRGKPGAPTFAVAGCYPTRKNLVSSLAVWTDEWCLMYSPLAGLNGSELFHRPSDPLQQRNVIAEQPQIAQELFDKLIGWLKRLRVSERGKRQLLFNEGFPALRKLRYDLSLWQKRLSYWKNHRHYARGD
jgi:arylsulfatase A-like enzyme